MEHSKTAETIQQAKQRMTSPQAAAVAGILFALLLSTSIFIMIRIMPTNSIGTREWLISNSESISFAMSLIPFAGIAFLWFMGVLREQLGQSEDQFFSTVILGSGLLFIASLFIWSASVSSLALSFTVIEGKDQRIATFYPFALGLIDQSGGVFALRMAGVFMISSGTIWLRTGVMPRWLTFVTYGIALSLVIGAGQFRMVQLAFPVWVFIVSVHILRKRYRKKMVDSGVS